MKPYQHEFIEFALAHKALLFGEFVLKSGRVSPYFFNSGQFNTGYALSKLGQFYADAIIDSNISYDLLFGPAYKGIPLVASIGIALFEKYGRPSPIAYNRKEKKEYGEGGNLVGTQLEGHVLVVDDVISAGTTFRETAQLIASTPSQIVGVVTALDRQERGLSDLSATQEIEKNYQIRSINIISLSNLITYLSTNPDMEKKLQQMQAYQKEYGVVTT